MNNITIKSMLLCVISLYGILNHVHIMFGMFKTSRPQLQGKDIFYIKWNQGASYLRLNETKDIVVQELDYNNIKNQLGYQRRYVSIDNFENHSSYNKLKKHLDLGREIVVSKNKQLIFEVVSSNKLALIHKCEEYEREEIEKQNFVKPYIDRVDNYFINEENFIRTPDLHHIIIPHSNSNLELKKLKSFLPDTDLININQIDMFPTIFTDQFNQKKRVYFESLLKQKEIILVFLQDIGYDRRRIEKRSIVLQKEQQIKLEEIIKNISSGSSHPSVAIHVQEKTGSEKYNPINKSSLLMTVVNTNINLLPEIPLNIFNHEDQKTMINCFNSNLSVIVSYVEEKEISFFKVQNPDDPHVTFSRDVSTIISSADNVPFFAKIYVENKEKNNFTLMSANGTMDEMCIMPKSDFIVIKPSHFYGKCEQKKDYIDIFFTNDTTDKKYGFIRINDRQKELILASQEKLILVHNPKADDYFIINLI